MTHSYFPSKEKVRLYVVMFSNFHDTSNKKVSITVS